MNRTVTAGVRRLGPGSVLVVVALGCGPAVNFATQHTVGAELGPCGAALDSVRAERGQPYRTIVGDEEDVPERTQRFEHEWGYLLVGSPPDTAAWRTDSLTVVRFRWGDGVDGCEVSERRARRLGGTLGPPWTEDWADHRR
ncbi:MAG TPA: hypothetical protein VNK43_06870 [Gemmatimonadales bacterium]|nr:hypothetical protein [Gemmatimonadales bacterium]